MAARNLSPKQRKARLIALTQSRAAHQCLRHGSDPTLAMQSAWRVAPEDVPMDVEVAVSALLAWAMPLGCAIPPPAWLRGNPMESE
jgi:hypothetical protein